MYLAGDLPRRPLPSSGLSVHEIARALHHFGHQTKFHAINREKSNPTDIQNFYRLITYYVESGIPVVASMGNSTGYHAMLIIGHQTKHYLKTHKESAQITSPYFKVHDTADIESQYIYMEDNSPAYMRGSLEKPLAAHYDQSFRDYKINHIIVPLHRSMYMDAEFAKKTVRTILNQTFMEQFEIPTTSVFTLRLMLTGSHSFKQYLATLTKKQIPAELKHDLVRLSLPKFIWLAELGTPDKYQHHKSDGFLVLDATGTESNQGFLLFLLQNKRMVLQESTVPNSIKPIGLAVLPEKVYTCVSYAGTFDLPQYTNNLRAQ
jgi:hypothetical protein